MADLFSKSSAEFSPCRTWRYVLKRQWGDGPAIGFILLNPSTADEIEDDPTIRRCIAYAKRWGGGSLVLGNVFALRSTDPKGLYSAVDPIGPENDEALLRIAREVAGGRLICGWGTHGAYKARGRDVVTMLLREKQKPMALTITKDGAPGHPLYLRADLEPFEL